MRQLSLYKRMAQLALSLGLGIGGLTACSQPDPAPNAGPTPADVIVNLGKIENVPWSDRLAPTPDAANPYADGRAFPWTGISVGGAGLKSQALGSGVNYLSDLTYTSASNGYGPIELDKSNGEALAGDGKVLTLQGVTFPKGLGVHANSTLVYTLSSACSTFNAVVGVDDEVGSQGSVSFRVFADGVSIFDSGVMTGASANQTVSVPITGKTELKLVVDGGADINFDHADWADAKVTCTAPTPSNNPFLSDLSPSAASNGWGPIEKDRSNGEQLAGDGKPLSIRGVTYPKGLGMHAQASTTYPLNANCTQFTALVGIDDEVKGLGSVIFQVFVDGVKLYDSGAVGGADAIKTVSVDVTGKANLQLVVDSNGIIDYDHADWVNPQLTCAVPVVQPPATPTIILNSPVGVVGGVSTFSIDDGTASSISWTFSDGGTAKGSDVTHNFTTPGLYTATVTLTYSNGQTATAQQQVAVLKAMKDIPAQRSLSSSMTASFDAGDPLPGFAYTWTFGDGSTGTGSRTQHTYSQLGTYDFTLGIKDTRVPALSVAGPRMGTQAVDPNAGQVFQDGGWITVWRKAPIAKLNIDTPAGRLVPPSPIAAGNYPFTAAFDASASSDVNLPAASALTYDWNFGDGTTVLTNGGPKPSHQYTTEGRFLVTLTVKNEFGLKDTFNSFVYSHDIRANIKLNTAYEAVGIQSLTADPPALLGTQSLKAQATIQTFMDYYPYVLHKSYSFKGGVGYSLNSAGTKINSFCTSMEAYANGGASLFSTKITSPTDDGSGTFCNGLLLGTGAFKFAPVTLNELLITNDSYLNTARASVFSGLVVPRINMAVYPDEFLPGDQASPIITTSTALNPLTGKTEWIMNVRIRESEMQGTFASANAQLRFKIPVMAVDATGKFMTTVNGRFKAAFPSTSFTSDCGDCTMVNGMGSITITLPVNQYTVAQPAIDLSAISLGNDSATRCGSDNQNSIYVKYGVNGCVLVGTSNVYPTSNAPLINGYNYPIGDPDTYFGHIVYGTTADSVRAYREYLSTGVYSDAKDFIVNNTPLLGSSKGFIDAMNALRTQGASIGTIANATLSGAGLLADVAPVVGKAVRPFLESLKFSQVGSKSVSKALDETISSSLASGRGYDGINADLQASFSTFGKTVTECKKLCSDQGEAIVDVYKANKGLGDLASLQKLETELKSTNYSALNLTNAQKISDLEASIECLTKTAGLSALARKAPKNLCASTITKVGELVTQVDATLDSAFINGGTNPTSAARAYTVTNGAGFDDAGHILAYVLGGAGGLKSGNIVPILASLNRGPIAQMESAVANLLKAGNKVTVEVKLVYGDAAHPSRPSLLTYKYTITDTTGVVKTVSYPFPNPVQ